MCLEKIKGYCFIEDGEKNIFVIELLILLNSGMQLRNQANESKEVIFGYHME